MADQFVPASEIAKLAQDSYESLHDLLSEAITLDRKKLFGNVESTRLIGTFPSHVVASSSDGQFKKIKWEQKNGSIRLFEAQLIKIPTYTNNNLSDYVTDQAKVALDSFFSGNKEAFSAHLSEMAVMVDEKPRMTDEEIAEKLVLLIREDRDWKKILSEKRIEIKGSIIDQIESLESSRLNKKFEKLYVGSGVSGSHIPTDKHEGFRDLVNQDFKYLGERLLTLTDLVSIALESVNSVKPIIKVESKDSPFIAFDTFSTALLGDLTEVCRIVVESVDRIKPVSALGKLYDCVAEELFNYEVAGRYVNRMATRICNSA